MMTHDCMGFLEPSCKDFTIDRAPDRGCHFLSAAGSILLTAGLGAGAAALTGGDPLKGALIGGGLGLGVSALGGAGGFSSGLSSIGSALGFGGGTSGGAASGASGASSAIPGGVGTGVVPIDPANVSVNNNIGPLGGVGPLSANAAATTAAGAGGASSRLGSIGQGLTALAALSSLTGGGSTAQQPLPGPASTAATQGPYFNAPLQYQAAPSRNPINPMSASSYATAGQRPEATYFGNNSLANFYTPTVAPASDPTNLVSGFPPIFPGGIPAARGGQPQNGALTMARGGDHSRFSTARGENFVRGGGDGTSDSVPAELSDGEYVLTAADVSRIGAGSNNAGAKDLDAFRADLARKAGQKQFVPAKAKGALSNLGKAA